jgi:hypothetical protein
LKQEYSSSDVDMKDEEDDHLSYELFNQRKIKEEMIGVSDAPLTE